MHELSIAQALVEQLEDVARREKAAAVTEVTVTIGGLSGVEPDALRLAFPVATEGTCAQDAVLTIDCVPATLTCRACGAVTHPELVFMACEECGSTDVALEGTRELLLSSVSLALEDPA